MPASPDRRIRGFRLPADCLGEYRRSATGAEAKLGCSRASLGRSPFLLGFLSVLHEFGS